MRKVVILGLLLIFTCGCEIKINNGENNYQSNDNQNNNSVNSNAKSTYGLDETFNFDDLEITIGSNYSYDVVENEFADENGQTVVKLPITVKNLKNETHGLNLFYYKIYGSNGTELNSLGYYFDEYIGSAGDLRSGASYTKYMYFKYDGDGTYAIEFNNFSEKPIVEFQIKK